MGLRGWVMEPLKLEEKEEEEEVPALWLAQGCSRFASDSNGLMMVGVSFSVIALLVMIHCACLQFNVKTKTFDMQRLMAKNHGQQPNNFRAAHTSGANRGGAGGRRSPG